MSDRKALDALVDLHVKGRVERALYLDVYIYLYTYMYVCMIYVYKICMCV